VVGGVGGWAAGVAGRGEWIGDWSLHLATVRAAALSPLAPEDPLVGGYVPSPYFSPYTLLLAVITRLSGLAPETVLAAAGVVNVGLLLWGVRVLSRRLGDRTATAVLAVAFVLLLWGTRPFAWSGFAPVVSLSFTQSYPSTMALALMPLCLAAFLRFRDEGRRADLALLTVLPALMLLIHPFTAAETAFVAAAFVLARPSAWPASRSLALACACAGALALAALWPYADMSGLVWAGPDFSRIHSLLVAHAFTKYWLVLVGVPALWHGVRLRLPLGRELVAAFAGGAVLVIVAVLLGRYEFTRLIPAIALMSHLALARHLGERPARAPESLTRPDPGRLGRLPAFAKGRLGRLPGVAMGRSGRLSGVAMGRSSRLPGVVTGRFGRFPAVVVGRDGRFPEVVVGWFGRVLVGAVGRRSYGVVVAVACVIGLYGAVPGLARGLPAELSAGFAPARTIDRWPGVRVRHSGDFARPYVREGDVVMVSGIGVARRLAGWGVRAVAPPYPYPFVPDEAERRAAQSRMFAAETPPGERLLLADRYGVRCVLATRPLEVPGFVQVVTAGKRRLLCRP
ncbi:hypothetical protein ACFO8L_41065, partial [Sphaerisporangium corydalis]